MTYNEANRLAAYNGETILYDEDNNMTWGPLNGVMTSFNYDSRNRLTEIGDTTYTYDANNYRIAVTEDNATKHYVVNPNAALSQILMEKDEHGNVMASYVYGLGLISREDAAGEISFYHYDLRGSTVALTDIDGNITDQYAYDSFGELVIQDGTTENPFLYNGRDGVTTESNGLYYMRARYYNPEIKRFINEDVILGTIEISQSLNRFAYVQGNPLIYVDPLGLVPSFLSNGGFPNFIPEATIIAELHYDTRERLNKDLPYTEEDARKSGWIKMKDSEAVLHQIGPGNEKNTKYISPDGGNREAVYKKGMLDTSPINKGSFNFIAPTSTLGKAGHIFVDVLPYYMFGNTREDTYNYNLRFRATMKGVNMMYREKTPQKNKHNNMSERK